MSRTFATLPSVATFRTFSFSSTFATRATVLSAIRWYSPSSGPLATT